MTKEIVVSGIAIIFFAFGSPAVFADYHFSNFKGRPPIHINGSSTKKPLGMSPDQVKAAYNLPASGGHGTIAIVGAYDDFTIENDLNVFSKTFNLPECTTTNGCFEKHKMSGLVKANSGWAMETSLDVEWAHAIAPKAKILLVEAQSGSEANLIAAVDYANKQPDVVAVSMSWGGDEFTEEASLDAHFASATGTDTVFFASSGDEGTGVSWPAVSPNVVAVGGTSLLFTSSSTVKETAWSGSGGGVSAYEAQPSYQTEYSIKKANGMRAVPDVSYNADPASGYSIYWSKTAKSKTGWYAVGGTSAGAPQWAAIQALGLSASNQNFYTDKASTKSTAYFRDIVSGKNGDCGYCCAARKHYDYVTGLGSPLTINF